MEASGHDADAAAMPALDAALAQLEETVGDREFVAELIGDFLDGLPAQLAAMREASGVDRRNIPRGIFSFQKVIGCPMTYGFRFAAFK